MLLGFASGVMIAASVWSLLIPSIEMAENQGRIAWIPASVRIYDRSNNTNNGKQATRKNGK